MASDDQTATSHHTPPTPDEQVENKVIEVVKPTEEENVSLAKKVEEEEIIRVEEATPLPKSEEETEDKQIEPPPVEVKEIDDTSAGNVSVEDKMEVKKVPLPDSNEPNIPGQVAVEVDDRPVAQTTIEPIEAEKQPAITPAENVQREESKIVDVPELVQTIEKPNEPLDAVPIQELATVVEKDIGDLAVSKEVDKPLVVPEGEVKQEEQSEVTKPESVAPEVEVKLEDQSEVSKLVEKPESVVPEVEVKLEDLSEVSKLVEKPESVASEVEVKLEDQSEATKIESIVSEVEAKLEDQIEVVKPVEKPESVEAIESPQEPSEVHPIEDSEATVVKDIKDSETIAEVDKSDSGVPDVEVKQKEQSQVSKEVEKQEPIVADLEVKPKEKTEVTPEVGVKCDAIEVKERIEDETVKDEAAGTDKAEEVRASSEQIVSTNQEAQFDLKGDGGESSLTDVTEKAVVETQAAEVTSNEKVVELENVGEEKEAKVINPEGESVATELLNKELLQPIKVEDVKEAVSNEVTENLLEGEKTAAGAEPIAENVKKNIEEEIPASVETSKVGIIEEKLDDITTTVTEQVKEAQNSGLEVEKEEGTETIEDKAEKEKVEEVEKSDVQVSTNDVDATETLQEQPREVPAKPSQKQSSNILSKVKQSLVKAKKAIIGKSPSPKTVSSDTKDDVKVK